MANKRYYWLKLSKDFFDQKEIKFIRRIAGGDTYTIIYLKMLLKSLNSDGKFYFDGVADNINEEIAMDIDEDTQNVSAALVLFKKYGLINDGFEEIEMTKSKQMTGSESASAERVRRHRDKKKLDNADSYNVTPELRSGNPETEKETDKRREREREDTEQEQFIANAIQNVSGVSMSSFSSIASQLIADALSKYSMSEIEQMFSYKWHDWDGWHKRDERFVVETLLSADNLDKYMSEMRQPKQRVSKREVHEKRPDFDKTKVPKVSAEDKVAAAATLEQLNGDQE